MSTQQKCQERSNFKKAMALARGSYQRNLVTGYETLGGSTLHGKARQYGGHYRKSADNLIERLRRHGVKFSIRLGPRGGYWSAVLEVE